MDSYENSLKIYRDLKGAFDTAFDDGKTEGRQEGRVERDSEIVRNMFEQGFSIEIIMNVTGLSREAIEKLK